MKAETYIALVCWVPMGLYAVYVVAFFVDGWLSRRARTRKVTPQVPMAWVRGPYRRRRWSKR